MNPLFSARPFWQNNGLFIIRIIVGAFMIYHGLEIFDKGKMAEYAKWEPFMSGYRNYLPWLGKCAELICGVLMFLGLYTRIAAILLAIVMAYISFFLGHGKIWYDDQHPFLFLLLAIIFFFTGPGNYSIDKFLFKKNDHA